MRRAVGRLAVGLAAVGTPALAWADEPPQAPPLVTGVVATPGGYNGVAAWAKPGRTPAYGGGSIGGGVPGLFTRRADGRDPATDGTWGWDYVGPARHPGRLFLGFFHDRPKQPQPGPYRTDGPHVPDPVAKHPIQKRLKGRDGGEDGHKPESAVHERR